MPKWLKSEVIGYLEEKILDGSARDDEEDFYNTYYLTNKLSKNDKITQRLLNEMNEEYNK